MPTNRPGYDAEYYHRLKSEIIHILGGQCEVCGTTEDLTFDHIVPLAEQGKKRPNGGIARLKEIRENIENISLKCVTCHIKRHKKDKKHKLHQYAPASQVRFNELQDPEAIKSEAK